MPHIPNPSNQSTEIPPLSVHMAATVGDPPKELHVSDALADAASATRKIKDPPPFGREAPWLFSLRCSISRGSGRDRAMAFRILSDGTAGVVYEDVVPEKYRRHSLVTSTGNCILLKSDKDQDWVYLVDPFSSSWTLVRKFPRCLPRSKSRDSLSKVVIHGDLAVGIQGTCRNRLVYMRLGIDDGWIHHKKLASFGSFSDLLFHDDSFYVLTTDSDKVVRLKFVPFPHIRGDEADVDLQDITFDLKPGFDPHLQKNNDHWACFQQGNLVESPSGLFVVRWSLLLYRRDKKKREIEVFKLFADKKRWVVVDSLDNYSFFLGMNQSLAVSPQDFPDLRTNLIYILYDALYPIDLDPAVDRDPSDEVDLNLIYDVKTKHWDRWDPRFSAEDEFLNGMLWSSVWMMPPRVKEPTSKRKLEGYVQAEAKAPTSDSSGSSDVIMSEQRLEP